MTSGDAIRLHGVGYAYGAGELARPALRDVDLSVGPGEIVLLTGPSGSGKTTLLTLIGALRAMQTGSAVVLGQELAGASERERVALRRRIGFIFQQHNLLGFLSARQNVAMALELDPRLAKRSGWSARATCSKRSVSATARMRCRPSSPADSGSGWRWRGRSPGSPA